MIVTFLQNGPPYTHQKMDMVTVNTSERLVTLHDLNDRQIYKVLPVILFLAVLMLFGIVGNSVVLYIYIRKVKPNTIRCFIIGLSVLELTISLVDIPLNIVEFRYQYTYGSYESICKSAHYIHDILFISDMSLLLAIAVERYKKVCRPFENQMTIPTARRIIIVCCLLSLFCSIPAFNAYGPKTVSLDNGRVNGTICAFLVDDPHNAQKTFTEISFVFWIIFNLAYLSILIVLYLLIWCKVYRHLKTTDSASPAHKTMVSFTIRRGPTLPETPTATSEAVETELMRSQISASSMESVHFKEETSGRSEGNHGIPRSRGFGVSRMTQTMFWVTTVSVFALLPIVCIMIVYLCSQELYNSLHKSIPSFAPIVMRTYYVHCASNPILYSFFNTRIIHEFKRLFSK